MCVHNVQLNSRINEHQCKTSRSTVLAPFISKRLIQLFDFIHSPMLVEFETHVPEHRPLLPLHAKREHQPHALLGISCVALSAVCFSLMSTLIKYNTYTMTSMEAIFWRSIVAMALNYVRGVSMQQEKAESVPLW